MRKLNFHLYGNDNHLEWGKGSRRLPVKEPNFSPDLLEGAMSTTGCAIFSRVNDRSS
ncbi:hypothetical protein COO91_11189 (plasmid) [Nostoc flagelliforme CCNUN1]|uniref:Uncharacterized protein n=1 Tax=Nostoc flagelliforme CCNUN1 TaxID=2038116 RepID=A0A2K8TB58_9NOSO|nr:hypothetical protein COO91_11189 [Nostoc flagelliforme CCNUN1]